MSWKSLRVYSYRSRRPEVFLRKVFLKISQNFQEKPVPETLFNKKYFIKKESLAQVFSCKFYEIAKNTFFYRTPPVTASTHRRV